MEWNGMFGSRDLEFEIPFRDMFGCQMNKIQFCQITCLMDFTIQVEVKSQN